MYAFINSVTKLFNEIFIPASLIRHREADEVSLAVGRRLAGTNHPRIALGADEEESPLQSKRSSM